MQACWLPRWRELTEGIINTLLKRLRWWTYQLPRTNPRSTNHSNASRVDLIVRKITGVDYSETWLWMSYLIAAENVQWKTLHWSWSHHQRLLRRIRWRNIDSTNFVYGRSCFVSMAKKNEFTLHWCSSSSSWQEYGNAFTEWTTQSISIVSTQAAAKNSVTTKQQASTTTTLKLSKWYTNRWTQSVSAVSASTQQPSVMSCWLQRWNKGYNLDTDKYYHKN